MTKGRERMRALAGPLVVALAVAAGVGLRFTHLDRKVCWVDETGTLRQIAGYSRAEIEMELVARRQFTAAELERYRRLSPGRGTGDMLLTLLADSPEITPLYFVLGRWCTERFGNSAASLRTLSAWLSLLALPAVFWLARELGGSARAGGLAMIFLALSPVHVLYAQEARMYSLWTLMIIVSCAGLLRAWRLNTAGSWRIYAATVALGWYTHLLFGLVLAAHMLCVLAYGRQARQSSEAALRRRRFWFAALAGTVAFAPWLLGATFGLGDFAERMGVAPQRPAYWQYGLRMISQFSLPFWDVNTDPDRPLLLETGWRVLLLLLVGCAVRELWRQDRAVGRLVLGLIVGGPLFLGAQDLWSGHQLALMHRYMMPGFIAVELAVVCFLARRWEWKRWRLVAVALAVSGLISCVAAVRAENWWTKGQNGTDAVLARVVNESPRPLLVADAPRTGTGLLTLAPRLGPHVTLRALWREPWPVQPDGFSDVFVFDPRGPRIAELRQKGYEKLSDVPTGLLWRLKK